MFSQYVSMKREGSAGQQKRALQMFTSRKIVNVKTLRESSLRDKNVFLRVHATPTVKRLKMENQPKLIVVVQ